MMWARSWLFHLYFDDFIWAGRRRRRGRRRGSGLRRGRNYSCWSLKFRWIILVKFFKGLDYVAFDSIITHGLNFTSAVKSRNDNFFELGSWLFCWLLRLGRWFCFSLVLCRFLFIFGLLCSLFLFNIVRIRSILIFSLLGFIFFLL